MPDLLVHSLQTGQQVLGEVAVDGLWWKEVDPPVVRKVGITHSKTINSVTNQSFSSPVAGSL